MREAVNAYSSLVTSHATTLGIKVSRTWKRAPAIPLRNICEEAEHTPFRNMQVDREEKGNRSKQQYQTPRKGYQEGEMAQSNMKKVKDIAKD